VLLWQAWKAYAHRAASYQSSVLLSLAYALVLGPAALLARLSGARLLDLRASGPTSWLERDAQDRSLEALRRQF
jgi:hypothetical protein